MDADSIAALSNRIDVAHPESAMSPRLTSEQLLKLGERRMSYVRTGLHAGEPIFVLYGADGRPLVMIEDSEQVVQVAVHLGLELNAVH